MVYACAMCTLTNSVLWLQLSSVYVGALPQEAAATGPAYERGLELLAVQVNKAPT